MMILELGNNNILIKNRYKLLAFTLFSVGLFSSLIENISAQEEIFPLWLKTTAVWWGEEKITDQDFVNSLQYLVDNKLLVIPEPKGTISPCGPGLVLNETSDCIIHDKSDTDGIFIETIDEQQKIAVSWIKVTTLWWGQNKLSDQDFMSALQYLIENNIITLESKIQSKPIAQLKPLPEDLIVLPKIDRIEDFKVQGHKYTDLYRLQFKLIDINNKRTNPDGTLSIVIMDDENRILYLDAFSIRKNNYGESFEAYGESNPPYKIDKDGKPIIPQSCRISFCIFTWEIKTKDVKPGFTDSGITKIVFTDKYGNNFESEIIPISVPQFN